MFVFRLLVAALRENKQQDSTKKEQSDCKTMIFKAISLVALCSSLNRFKTLLLSMANEKTFVIKRKRRRKRCDAHLYSVDSSISSVWLESDFFELSKEFRPILCLRRKRLFRLAAESLTTRWLADLLRQILWTSHLFDLKTWANVNNCSECKDWKCFNETYNLRLMSLLLIKGRSNQSSRQFLGFVIQSCVTRILIYRRNKLNRHCQISNKSTSSIIKFIAIVINKLVNRR